MARDATTPSREGRLLAGKYRLERLLGSGGIGEVYRAQNELIGRTVAIKLLRPERAAHADTVARFLREARAANLVRHPNVVDVLDLGTDEDGTPFIVQEFLEGEDLAQLLDRAGGRLPADRVLELMIPVLDAVALAHTRGVVHRDLKPENVFLHSADGGVVPKVLDFGLSKIADPARAVRVTSTGTCMGTPAYMSPEQIQGAGDVDARADVWAVGVMLHELIAGALPFPGESAGAIFVQVCTADPVPLEQAAPGVPPDLARVVARCLRRDPAERYQTASEVVRDLRNVRDVKPLGATRRLAAVRIDDLPQALAPGGSGRTAGAPLHATLDVLGEGPTLNAARQHALTRSGTAPVPAVALPVAAPATGAAAQGHKRGRAVVVAAALAAVCVGGLALSRSSQPARVPAARPAAQAPAAPEAPTTTIATGTTPTAPPPAAEPAAPVAAAPPAPSTPPPEARAETATRPRPRRGTRGERPRAATAQAHAPATTSAPQTSAPAPAPRPAAGLPTRRGGLSGATTEY